MEVKYLTIKPTNVPDESDYKTGIVTCYGENDVVLGTRTCDSFWTIGDIQCDFETDGGIKMWAFNGGTLEVELGYTTCIYATANAVLNKKGIK